MYKYTWRCSLHGATGDSDDDSLTRHQDEEHDGANITIMVQKQ